MSTFNKKVDSPLVTKLEVKVTAEPYSEDAMVVGTNIQVWCRVRNGREVSEWFPLPAKSLEITAVPTGFAKATVAIRADVVEIDNMRALVQEIEIERERKGMNGTGE